DYLNNIKEIKHITYKYDISMPLVTDNYKLLLNNYMIPIKKEQINNNYYVLAGRNIENKNEILLKVDSNNNVTNELLNTFNIDKDIEYSEILGRKIKLILNDNYYKKDNNYYHINDNLKEIYQESKLELTIVGVVKEKEITDESNYIIYSQEIIKDVLEANEKSIIVKEQLKKDYNILGNNLSIEDNLSFLGYKTIPSTINIYVDNIKDKEKVINKLDEYNKNNKELIYEDAMNDAISIVKDFMNIITAILVIFSFISLLVSMILISVITNTRVLERIKEIGILRSLGASKKNIRKLFNIENSIISILSFVISISTILLIKKTLNTLLYSIIESNTIFKLEYSSLILVFIFNLLLVLLSGLIPSIKASNIEITECIKR
ncbi:MAG: FtsX-like permease family protein, partial [Bacilli bacterium]|nr:FtsX-like permease family protein [Bacilli bacterium]